MSQIGLFYGTQTGNTQTEAELIQQELGRDSVVDLHDISRVEASDFDQYNAIIIGCPTWNVGELQSDWEDFFDQLDNIDFSGKKVAYFG
nr:flavodoxin domain-containing protein [Oculatellaceae cyanobacterium Prado106]